jgi:hypothetical protein
MGRLYAVVASDRDARGREACQDHVSRFLTAVEFAKGRHHDESGKHRAASEDQSPRLCDLGAGRPTRRARYRALGSGQAADCGRGTPRCRWATGAASAISERGRGIASGTHPARHGQIDRHGRRWSTVLARPRRRRDPMARPPGRAVHRRYRREEWCLPRDAAGRGRASEAVLPRSRRRREVVGIDRAPKHGW